MAARQSDDGRLLMIRRDLQSVPRFEVPRGYGLRWYQPGDEAHWLNIHLAAEHHEQVGPELFARRFGSDSRVLAERQLYLIAADHCPIGTATAWHDPAFEGQSFGRVHYVAVIPEYQGQGLPKPLMTSVLLRLKELGHHQAYLATSAARLPAINLYLSFGFEPLIRDSAEEALWQLVVDSLRGYRNAPFKETRHT